MGSDLSSRVVRTEAAGRNTFGTNCFGEKGLKIRPEEVFRHDNCEQFFEALYLSTIFLFSHKNEKGSETMFYIDSYLGCLRGVTRYLLA